MSNFYDSFERHCQLSVRYLYPTFTGRCIYTHRTRHSQMKFVTTTFCRKRRMEHGCRVYDAGTRTYNTCASDLAETLLLIVNGG